MRDQIKWELEDSIIGLVSVYPEKFADLFFEKISKVYFRSEENQKAYGLLYRLHSQRNIAGGLFNPQVSSSNPELWNHIRYCMTQFDYRESQFEVFLRELHRYYQQKKAEDVLVGAAQMILEGASSSQILGQYLETLKEDEDLFRENIYSLAYLTDIHGTEEAYRKMNESSIKFGFTDFDEKVIVKNGDLIILAGRPSSGKTDVALAMSKNIAKQGIPVGFVSLEMRAQYLMNRLALGESDEVDKMQRYLGGCEKIASLPIWIDESPKHDLSSLHKTITKMTDLYSVKIIFIDYLTLLNPPQSENRTQEITKLIGGIKMYAREFNVPIVVLSQLSREVEKRSNKKPRLSDLRESGAIEQDADLVVFTYRPYIYDIKKDKNGVELKYHLMLCIQKQRDGAIADIPIFYDAENKKFGNWTGTQLKKQEEPF